MQIFEFAASLIVGRKNTGNLNSRRELILLFSASLLTTEPSIPINELKSCLLCLRFSYLQVAFCPYFRHQVRFLLMCFQLDEYDLFCLFQGSLFCFVLFFQLSGFVVCYLNRDENSTKKWIVKHASTVEKEG